MSPAGALPRALHSLWSTVVYPSVGHRGNSEGQAPQEQSSLLAQTGGPQARVHLENGTYLPCPSAILEA